MPTWEELLKNRKEIKSLRNSTHMLECMKIVTKKYQKAEIVEDGKGQWRLVNGDEALSNSHDSHYACWMEAREVMRVADQ
jgi:hypothetical protein